MPQEINQGGEPCPNLPCQLQIVNNVRITHIQKLWNIFNMFWAANALFLVALFQNSDTHFILIKWTVIPITGIFFSLIWFYIGSHSLIFMDYYDDLIKNLENECKIPPEFHIGVTNPRYNHFISGIHTKPVMKYLPIFGVGFWTIELFFGVYLLHLYG